MYHVFDFPNRAMDTAINQRYITYEFADAAGKTEEIDRERERERETKANGELECSLCFNAGRLRRGHRADFGILGKGTGRLSKFSLKNGLGFVF